MSVNFIIKTLREQCSHGRIENDEIRKNPDDLSIYIHNKNKNNNGNNFQIVS